MSSGRLLTLKGSSLRFCVSLLRSQIFWAATAMTTMTTPQTRRFQREAITSRTFLTVSDGERRIISGSSFQEVYCCEKDASLWLRLLPVSSLSSVLVCEMVQPSKIFLLYFVLFSLFGLKHIITFYFWIFFHVISFSLCLYPYYLLYQNIYLY